MLMRHHGASEVYHNGMLIKQNGEIREGENNDRNTDPAYLPVSLHFGSDSEQLIAVRYANENAKSFYEKYNTEVGGFSMSLMDDSAMRQTLVGTSLGVNLIIILTSIFLVLGGLHLLLFLFFRENLSNLYYSIFSILFALVILTTYFQTSSLFNPAFVLGYGFYLSLMIPVVFFSLEMLVYNILDKSIPKIVWISGGMAIILMVLMYLSYDWVNAVLGGFILLIFIDIFRVVIRAMIKKVNGAWIVGTGIIFFILFISFIIIIAMWQGSYAIQGGSAITIIVSLMFILAIVSIPLSMSLYLARDFAKTNKNLKLQLENVKVLSAKTIEQEKEKQRILEGQKEKLEQMVDERTRELADEKEKTEQLLLNTLPLKVVNDLKANGKTEPENFEDVTVYFSDIVGFTKISSQLEPAKLIHELNDIFTAFDDIMERNHCERIKTIGDAYLAVCGMPERNPNHAYHMSKAALEIREFLKERNKGSEIEWKIRIGLHSGKVVGGVVGVKKYIYDVFGDTINTSSRMESNSEAMKINISEVTHSLIKNKFSFTEREPMEIKGKGLMKMYFLDEKAGG
jgi:class 3 adenylate cyclase